MAIRDGHTGYMPTPKCPECKTRLFSDTCQKCGWKRPPMKVTGAPVRKGLKKKNLWEK